MSGLMRHKQMDLSVFNYTLVYTRVHQCKRIRAHAINSSPRELYKRKEPNISGFILRITLQPHWGEGAVWGLSESLWIQDQPLVIRASGWLLCWSVPQLEPKTENICLWVFIFRAVGECWFVFGTIERCERPLPSPATLRKKFWGNIENCISEKERERELGRRRGRFVLESDLNIQVKRRKGESHEEVWIMTRHCS